MPLYQHFQIERHGEVTELCLEDEQLSDSETYQELSRELAAFIEIEQPAKLLISFRSVSHCTSVAVNSLLNILKLMEQYSGQLRLCDMSEDVRETYRLLNLDGTLFEIHESRDEALQSFDRRNN
jgi:anti-anti-sigma factor